MTEEQVTLETLADDLVAYAQDDYTMFSTPLAFVRRHPEVCGAGGEKEAVLAIVEAALRQGVVPGGFDQQTKAFVPWGLSPEDAVARMRREWESLDHDPIGGEVGWFVIPQQKRE